MKGGCFWEVSKSLFLYSIKVRVSVFCRMFVMQDDLEVACSARFFILFLFFYLGHPGGMSKLTSGRLIKNDSGDKLNGVSTRHHTVTVYSHPWVISEDTECAFGILISLYCRFFFPHRRQKLNCPFCSVSVVLIWSTLADLFMCVGDASYFKDIVIVVWLCVFEGK